jgi:hypothetical protein
MNRFGLSVVLSVVAPFVFFAQLTNDWVMTQLATYSKSSYEIISGYKINGSTISYNGYSRTISMHHLEYCNLKDLASFLSSISTTVHETAHGFDSQIPYMQAKQGATFKDLSETEGFYLNESTRLVIEFPEQALFPSKLLFSQIPESLRTFRFNTYIMANPSQSTQCSGVIGLLDEFNAYYHGSKVLSDLYPLFVEAYGPNVAWQWPSQFVSNADAFYEFDFFIKEYLLFAKTQRPALYMELKNNPNFRIVYQTIRRQFEQLIYDYERKFDQLTKENKSGGWSTTKHQKIYETLKDQIQSSRYQTVVDDFLGGGGNK